PIIKKKSPAAAPVEEIPAPKAPAEAVVPSAPETAPVVRDVTPTAPPQKETEPLRLYPGVALDNVNFAPIYTPSPVYPPIAKKASIQGYVDVDLLIGEDGRVKKYSIVTVSGHPSFGNEVAAVIPRWRFPPPRYKGKKVEIKYLYRVNFKLD
ncbi:MAG: TonB family protein, partial [Chitinivibrionales bacterium]|nr:TonB family protein [Chitinivibrionales bacterium]MBD3356217.1 TonB family protein [Chitinivibrionales bacterium]